MDLFNTFKILGRDIDVKLFCIRWADSVSGRGMFSGKPELPVEVVDVRSLSRRGVLESLEGAVAAWGPDMVFVADGWTLKPYLIDLFRRRWPLAARFYAYECLCPRNNERWLPEGRCENHALLDCARCLDCAAGYCKAVRERRGGDNPLTEEMRVAEMFSGDYEKVLRSAMDGLNAIVYNRSIAGILENFGNARASVVPGGVDLAFHQPPDGPKPGGDGIFRILVAGRMDDAAKGAATAVEAGRMLAKSGLRFKMTLTKAKSSQGEEWLDECGWKSREELRALMSGSDCAVVPSLWEEAFGMVWAESMSSGLPVVASATPGPKEFIVHEGNGLLFNPGDAAGLADMLLRLASDVSLRRRLSEAGLRTARERLTWDKAAEATRRAILDGLGGGAS